MTQCEKILEYMHKYGSISAMEVFRDLGCTRLASRINDLRNQGYAIKSGFVTSKNRYGEKVSFKRYSLEGQE